MIEGVNRSMGKSRTQTDRLRYSNERLYWPTSCNTMVPMPPVNRNSTAGCHALRASNQQYTGPHMRPEDQMSGAATILVIHQESNILESSTTDGTALGATPLEATPLEATPLEATRAFLRSKGWTALTAHDPESALNLLAQADLIIASLKLLDRAAIQLTRRITSVHADRRIPILLVSPRTPGEATLAILFDAGADDYIEMQ